MPFLCPVPYERLESDLLHTLPGRWPEGHSPQCGFRLLQPVKSITAREMGRADWLEPVQAPTPRGEEGGTSGRTWGCALPKEESGRWAAKSRHCWGEGGEPLRSSPEGPPEGCSSLRYPQITGRLTRAPLGGALSARATKRGCRPPHPHPPPGADQARSLNGPPGSPHHQPDLVPLTIRGAFLSLQMNKAPGQGLAFPRRCITGENLVVGDCGHRPPPPPGRPRARDRWAGNQRRSLVRSAGRRPGGLGPGCAALVTP